VTRGQVKEAIASQVVAAAAASGKKDECVIM
jgi:hypothetical protein